MEESEVAWSAWSVVLAGIDYELPESTVRIWFEPIRLAGEAEGALCLLAPPKVFTWVRRRYGELIGRTVRELTDYRGAFIALAPEDVDEDEGLL